MEKFYVVLRRLFMKEDIVSLYDEHDAFEGNWVDSNGNRTWVVPPEDEKTATFVWEFDNLEVAFTFYNNLRKNEIGIKVSEL